MKYITKILLGIILLFVVYIVNVLGIALLCLRFLWDGETKIWDDDIVFASFGGCIRGFKKAPGRIYNWIIGDITFMNLMGSE